jgi:hypothetical protein
MLPPPDEARLRWLEANADRPDVQELIRQEIVRGNVRVVPGPGDGIRIIPVRAADRAAEGPSSGQATRTP